MTKSAEFKLKIQRHDAKVGIIGLGYVGLPLAMAFVNKGFRVTGYDVDTVKIDMLGKSKSYIKHLGDERVAEIIATDRFFGTTDFSSLGEPDVLIICVPTPLTAQRDPDMSYVVSTTAQIAKCLRPGQLIVLESTTYPGTTDELVKGILEKTGLMAGKDFYLAFSPEREDPGNQHYETSTIPKVVGGYDQDSGDIAEALYNEVITRTVRVSSARTAEAAKLTENIFRAVNIALVNELKVIYQKMGINIWEVLDAAETKPFGFMRFNPGPGWGGHCIPLDPFYLSWKAREYGINTKFIELAGEVNVAMPQWVIGKLAHALNDRQKSMRGSKVLLLGLAYKKDIDDSRESPALEIMALLEEQGVHFDYHDPHVPSIPRTRHSPEKEGMKSISLSGQNVGDYDAVMIVTDHTSVDYKLVANHAKLIIDTRGVYQRPAWSAIEGLSEKLVLA